MKLSKAIKYNIWTNKKSVLIFASIMAAVVVFLCIMFKIAGITSDDGGGIGSVDFSFYVYVFVTGIVMFTESTKMFLQNGISRKTMFKANIITFAAMSVLFSVVILLIYILGDTSTFFYVTPIVKMVYEGYLSGFSTIVQYGMFFLNSIAIFMFAATFGYFCGLLFTRLNKLMRVLVPVGLGVIFIVLIPLVDKYITGNAISNAIGEFFFFITGASNGMNINIFSACMLVISLLLVVFSWLIMRRITIKEK